MASDSVKGKELSDNDKNKIEGTLEDVAWPNEAWSDVAKEIFHQLNAGTEGFGWKRYPGFLRTGDRRLFSRNIAEQGKGFEFAVFVNKKEQRAKGVCQFGPYLEGGPGNAHGGAVATILDVLMGMCATGIMEGLAVTANLNINYKSAIRLGSTVLLHAKVDRIEGRKCYVSGYVTSADCRTTLCEATGIFIRVPPEHIKNQLYPDLPNHLLKGSESEVRKQNSKL